MQLILTKLMLLIAYILLMRCTLSLAQFVETKFELTDRHRNGYGPHASIEYQGDWASRQVDRYGNICIQSSSQDAVAFFTFTGM